MPAQTPAARVLALLLALGAAAALDGGALCSGGPGGEAEVHVWAGGGSDGGGDGSAARPYRTVRRAAEAVNALAAAARAAPAAAANVSVCLAPGVYPVPGNLSLALSACGNATSPAASGLGTVRWVSAGGRAQALLDGGRAAVRGCGSAFELRGVAAAGFHASVEGCSLRAVGCAFSGGTLSAADAAGGDGGGQMTAGALGEAAVAAPRPSFEVLVEDTVLEGGPGEAAARAAVGVSGAASRVRLTRARLLNWAMDGPLACGALSVAPSGDASLEVDASEFTNVTCGLACGILAAQADGARLVSTVRGTTFRGCAAVSARSGLGGAVAFLAAPGGGGGGGGGGSATLDACSFDGNSAGATGGAVASVVPLVITGCTFVGNRAQNGGALWAAAAADVSGSHFSENAAVAALDFSQRYSPVTGASVSWYPRGTGEGAVLRLHDVTFGCSRVQPVPRGPLWNDGPLALVAAGLAVPAANATLALSGVRLDCGGPSTSSCWPGYTPSRLVRPAVPVPGLLACEPCPAGTVAPPGPKGAYTSCVPCPPGTYSPAASPEPQCILCLPGRHAGSSGSGSCAACAPGRAAADAGQSACTACSPGSSAIRPGQSVCDECPANSYTDEAGLQFCLPCSLFTSSDAGSPACLRPRPWIMALIGVACGLLATLLVWASCRLYNTKLDRDVLARVARGPRSLQGVASDSFGHYRLAGAD